MRWAVAVFAVCVLWVSYGWAAELDDPPPTSETDTYLWEKSVVRKLHVLTTTNRLPVSGRLSGRPGQMLFAKTSTNKGILFINIGSGPGESSDWGEVPMR